MWLSIKLVLSRSRKHSLQARTSTSFSDFPTTLQSQIPFGVFAGKLKTWQDKRTNITTEIVEHCVLVPFSCCSPVCCYNCAVTYLQQLIFALVYLCLARQ